MAYHELGEISGFYYFLFFYSILYHNFNNAFLGIVFSLFRYKYTKYPMGGLRECL